MPVNPCELDSLPGFKWGDSGKCFTYLPGNERSTKSARDRAVAQGAAVQLRRLKEIQIAARDKPQLSQKKKIMDPIILELAKGMQEVFRIWSDVFMKGFVKFQPLFPPPGGARESVRFSEVTVASFNPLMDDANDAAHDLFDDIMNTTITAAIVGGGDELLGQLDTGIDFNIESDPNVLAYMATVGGDRITRIEESTKRMIRGVLLRAIDEGWDWQTTALELEARFAQWGITGPPLRKSLAELETRAEVIAVTEIGNAYEAGARATADHLATAGIPIIKRWVTVGDLRVSDMDRKNQAEGFLPLDQPHDSGHQHPLSHPGCRCTEVYRVGV